MIHLLIWYLFVSSLFTGACRLFILGACRFPMDRKPVSAGSIVLSLIFDLSLISLCTYVLFFEPRLQ